jgi:glycosyltransferase involved in cell wall biosynthesis
MLSETLKSVQEQTLAPAEIIVIDDCSKTPLEQVTEFSPELPVRFLRHAQNRGPAGSVVHGIRESRCELVTTLNHDDVWEPRFLEVLGGELDTHPQAAFAFCDHGIMLADGEHDERRSLEQSRRFGRAGLTGGVLGGAELYEAALMRKAVAASSFALMRREALDHALIEAGGDMWDYFLAVGACRKGEQAVYVAERLGWYRLSPTMLTTTWADPRKQVEMARSQVAILVVMLRSPQFGSVHGALRRRLVATLRHVLAAAVRTGDPRSLVRVSSRVLEGLAEARRLLAREGGGGEHPAPSARPGLSGEV